MKKICLALSVAALAAGAAPATAQEPAPAGPFPVMGTMDRVTDHTNFNGSLGFGIFDSDSNIDLGLRLDLGGQWLSPQGFGAYGALPISHAAFDVIDDSETALGNIEVGGLYLAPAGTVDVLLRGGVSLATGPDVDDDLAFASTVLNGFSRLADFTSVGGGVTWLRLSASPLYRQGNLFLRADAGFDLPVSEPEGQDSDPLIRLNLGGGANLGTVTVSGELVTTGTTESDADEQFMHTLAGTVAFDAGSIRPYGALVIPLDENIRDLITFTLMAGIEVPIAAR